MVATTVGVLGGLAGVIVLILQTIATKQTAEARLARVKQKRAWLIVRAIPPENCPIRHPQYDKEQTIFTVRLRVENAGEALAWIDEIRARFFMVKAAEPMEGLPLNPDIEAAGVVLAEPIPLAPKAIFETQNLDLPPVDGIQEIGDTVVLYGIRQVSRYHQHHT